MFICCKETCHLSDGEQATVDFINANQEIIGTLSISDIAERTYVSASTVSRAVRKCGFSSFSELKYRISSNSPDSHDSYEVNDILSKSYRECMQTLQSIRIDAVLQVVSMLREAQCVFVVANGLTALVAEEFATYLRYQQINAWCVSDAHLMHTLDHLIKKEDLLVIVSVKNTMPDLAIAGRLAKSVGARVAVLCCQPNTDLDAIADVAVHGSSSDLGSHLAVTTTSRLGLYIITRTIAEYMRINKEGKT